MKFARGQRSRLGTVGRLLAATCVIAVSAGCEISGAQAVGYEPQVQVANRFLQNNEYRRAYELLDDVSARYADQGVVQLEIGDTYLRNGAFLKAEIAYLSAARLGFTREANLGLGRIDLARNDPEAAMTRFIGVIKTDPSNAEALNGLGVAHDMIGDHEKARSYYSQALRRDPSDLRVVNNIGLSYALSGESAKAIDVLSELVASNRDDAVARQNLSIAYASAGLDREAVQLASNDLSENDAQRLFGAVRTYGASAYKLESSNE